MTNQFAVAEVALSEEIVSEEQLVSSATKPAVRETLADIFADCRRDPEQYLEETISPLGGE